MFNLFFYIQSNGSGEDSNEDEEMDWKSSQVYWHLKLIELKTVFNHS